MLKLPLGAYLAKWTLIWHREISLKVAAHGQWNYRNIYTSTCSLLAEILASSRINFEGPAFASKAILRKRPLVVTVSHLHLHISLNNSYILEKKLIIPLII